MKKKLLITMGCSLTEGVGCYDINTINKKYLSMTIDEIWTDSNFYEMMEINKLNSFNFHAKGWPNRVGKKLGYDKVLNLGLGGSSTSAQVKLFFEKYPHETFKDWEVLVLFMLPDPSRFSFYINSKIMNFLPQFDGEIERAYLNLLENDMDDPVSEQIFYIQIMEEVCKNRNFNFIYFNHDITVNDFLNQSYRNPDHHLTLKTTNGLFFNPSDEYRSLICHHPNELGYEFIAKNIYNSIEDEFPQYINEAKDEIEWEWDGEPLLRMHKSRII